MYKGGVSQFGGKRRKRRGEFPLAAVLPFALEAV